MNDRLVGAFFDMKDLGFTCKWALEFGDPRLLRALAKKHPDALIRAAIELGHISWMLDVVRDHGIGMPQFQEHILNRESADDLAALLANRLANCDEIRRKLADNLTVGMANSMMQFLSKMPTAETALAHRVFEELLVAAGIPEVIQILAKHKWCTLAQETLRQMRDCEHVMTS